SDYAANPAQYAETNVVYFFHAPWCPTCKATEEDAQAKKANLPAGLTLVKVDYDSATDLKRKYGITAQHTFVKVDKTGGELKKWAGTISVADIAAKAA
ncbi:MAG: thioredoxin family protein, partial [Angustibacter sp.]